MFCSGDVAARVRKMWAVSGRAKDSRRPSSRKEQARLILLLFGGIPNSPLTCKCRAREMLAGSG